jgi:hypothetical protein
MGNTFQMFNTIQVNQNLKNGCQEKYNNFFFFFFCPFIDISDYDFVLITNVTFVWSVHQQVKGL